MSKPTLSTVSKLYCVSGNRCAYPDCATPLLESNSRVLMAEVCHIRADKSGGPRYDLTQSDDERHGFDNLIIMCCSHHKVIDTDVRTWTVEKLIEVKRRHESSTAQLPEPTNALVEELQATAASVVVGELHGGSVITTINQSGGQVAHQIVNQGDPQRTIHQSKLDGLVQLLARQASAKFFISAPMGYSEAHRLGECLYFTLKRAGWTSDAEGVGQRMGMSAPVTPGIELVTEKLSLAMRTFADWCDAIGLQPRLYVGKYGGPLFPDALNILVGPSP